MTVSESAGILYAQLQLLRPGLRSVLLAPVRSSDEAFTTAAALLSIVQTAGKKARFVDVRGPGRKATSIQFETHSTAGSTAGGRDGPEAASPDGPPEAARWDLEATRSWLEQFDGLTIAAGGGILDDPATLIAAAASDAVVLVVRAGATDSAELETAAAELQRIGACFVGAVLKS